MIGYFKTVREYYQILIDTFLGTRIEPFHRRKGRRTITQAAKFYLFDVGVAGSLLKRIIQEERGEEFGRAFEHFILMEILAYRSYKNREFEIQFWRTKSGLEVDFVLGQGEAAIEIKGTPRVDKNDVRGLAAFAEEFSPRKSILVCNESQERLHGKIHLLPWRKFLALLWEGKII